MSVQPFNPIAGGPCASLAEAAVHARRPFMPDLVQAKIHSAKESFADVAYYIDVRAVMDRLNVLLPGRWHASYELIDQRPGDEDNDPLLVYRCSLTVAEATYSDVGEGSDHKAAQSDALKRAAVHVGIGHCVYRIAGPRMFAGEGAHELRKSRKGRFYLDAANERWLRQRYRSWLTELGVAEYGLPLDHGEAARAQEPTLFPQRYRRAAAGGNGAAKEGREAQPVASNGEDATAAVATMRSAGGSAVQVPATALVPVAQPETESPASPQQRAALLEMAAARGYSAATVQALARCVCETLFDRLGARGLHDVRAYLDSGAGGRLADQDLAAKLAELKTGEPDSDARREQLAAWLLEREEAAAAAPEAA